MLHIFPIYFQQIFPVFNGIGNFIIAQQLQFWSNRDKLWAFAADFSDQFRQAELMEYQLGNFFDLKGG